jgi:hypothetical protein
MTIKFIILSTPVFFVIVKAPIKNHCPITKGIESVNIDINNYVFVAFD